VTKINRAADRIRILGVYVTDDPGAADSAAKKGCLAIRFGLGWAESHILFAEQTPVHTYNR
jgi:glutathione-independent formaldehyde dehydrogenase